MRFKNKTIVNLNINWLTPTKIRKLYISGEKGMFLVDSAQASDWDAVVKTVKTILKRSDVEMVSIRNWAERKLAYEINLKSRRA